MIRPSARAEAYLKEKFQIVCSEDAFGGYAFFDQRGYCLTYDMGITRLITSLVETIVKPSDTERFSNES